MKRFVPVLFSLLSLFIANAQSKTFSVTAATNVEIPPADYAYYDKDSSMIFYVTLDSNYNQSATWKFYTKTQYLDTAGELPLRAAGIDALDAAKHHFYYVAGSPLSQYEANVFYTSYGGLEHWQSAGNMGFVECFGILKNRAEGFTSSIIGSALFIAPDSITQYYSVGSLGAGGGFTPFSGYTDEVHYMFPEKSGRLYGLGQDTLWLFDSLQYSPEPFYFPLGTTTGLLDDSSLATVTVIKGTQLHGKITQLTTIYQSGDLLGSTWQQVDSFYGRTNSLRYFGGVTWLTGKIKYFISASDSVIGLLGFDTATHKLQTLGFTVINGTVNGTQPVSADTLLVFGNFIAINSRGDTIRNFAYVVLRQDTVTTSVNTIQTAPLFIYPNPTSTTLFFETDESGQYYVTNSLGQIIQQSPFHIGRNEIYTEQYSVGVYCLIALRKDGTTQVAKFIITQ